MVYVVFTSSCVEIINTQFYVAKFPEGKKNQCCSVLKMFHRIIC